MPTDEPPTTTGMIELNATELLEHIAAIRAGKGNTGTHRAMAWECLDYLTRGL